MNEIDLTILSREQLYEIIKTLSAAVETIPEKDAEIYRLREELEDD